MSFKKRILEEASHNDNALFSKEKANMTPNNLKDVAQKYTAKAGRKLAAMNLKRQRENIRETIKDTEFAKNNNKFRQKLTDKLYSENIGKKLNSFQNFADRSLKGHVTSLGKQGVNGLGNIMSKNPYLTLGAGALGALYMMSGGDEETPINEPEETLVDNAVEPTASASNTAGPGGVSYWAYGVGGGLLGAGGVTALNSLFNRKRA